MKRPICPVCNNRQKITVIYKSLNKIGDLLKCKKCGLYFMWPKQIYGESKQTYTKEYYNTGPLNKLKREELSEMKRATFSRIIDIVSKYKSRGALLDIGCAFGDLLEVAKKRGWDSYGIEESEYTAREAGKIIGGDKIMVGDFMDLALPKDKFDVITMIDVIEHIHELNNLLGKCKALLKKEGLLVIVTPDVDSLSRKCLRKYWPHFNEEHIMFLPRKNIKCILDMYDFRLLEISNFTKAFNFYYIRSMVRAHCKEIFILLVEIVNTLTPPAIKKKNFFMPHGGMVIVAQK